MEQQPLLYTAHHVDNRFGKTMHRDQRSVNLKTVTLPNSESVLLQFLPKVVFRLYLYFPRKYVQSGTVVETFASSPKSLNLSYSRQAESTSYYSLKNMPSQKERIVFVPFLSRELWFLGIVLKSWRILHGHVLHFDFVSKTASCSTSKETKRQRTSNIRFKPRKKCYCYVVWDHLSYRSL